MNVTRNLQTMLTHVHDGKITFGEFVAGTRKDFRQIALYLLRRWISPVWFSVDDVEQELYLGAWNHIWRYEPCLSNGVSLGRYVVYNAMASAKTQLHKARGVTISGSPDRKTSNIETPLAFYGDDGEGEALLESILAEKPIVEEILIEEDERAKAATKVLKVCETPAERAAVLAIREAGSLENAGQVLYNDFDSRIEFRLGNEDKADRFVFRHARAAAERATQISV